MPGTPGGGELGGGLVAERAVRPALVVVGAPCPDDLAGFGARSEPALVQALVAEPAVEALHVRVLRRLASLDQPQRHAVTVGPAVERVAGELRTLVGPDQLRQAAELPDPIEHPRHIIARDAMIDRDIDRFLRIVIDDRQALKSPSVLEAVANEVDGPHLVRRPWHLERAAVYRRATPRRRVRRVTCSLSSR